MQITWTRRASADSARVYRFNVRVVDEGFAKDIAKMLNDAPKMLRSMPRMGERLHQYDPREVHRIFVGDYEVRYEIKGETIFIIRLWSTREDR